MMENADCKICASRARPYADFLVRNRYACKVYSCSNCGFVFLAPLDWLKEADGDVIAPSDVGYVSRNLAAANFLGDLLRGSTSASDLFVDFGGGYGLLVRLMRDKGFRFHLHEPVAANLFAKNCYADCKLFGKYRALTAVEVFEHLVSPADALLEMLNFSRSVIFTTELCPVPRPMPDRWWYFGPEHGQHVSFYTEQALEQLGTRHRLEYCHLGSNWHILAPHDDPILALARSKSARSNGRGVLSIARFGRLAGKFLVGEGERTSLREHDFNAMRRILATADSLAAQEHIDQPHQA